VFDTGDHVTQGGGVTIDAKHVSVAAAIGRFIKHDLVTVLAGLARR
ncbi:MAG: hypothetical protein ACJA2P_000673, partial [Rhodoferax sp.]